MFILLHNLIFLGLIPVIFGFIGLVVISVLRYSINLLLSLALLRPRCFSARLAASA
jgi:hypothetical protein